LTVRTRPCSLQESNGWSLRPTFSSKTGIVVICPGGDALTKVFIGSSTGSGNTAREIATWLEAAGSTPVPWYDQFFKPGDITLTALEQAASDVQGAVFVFAEDDALDGGAGHVVRGNVVFESGLFMAKLGRKRVVICRDGDPKRVSNLDGVTYVDVGERNKHTARRTIEQWARTLPGQPSIVPPEPPLFWSHFPLTDFKRELAAAKQLRILQTFIPIAGHLDAYRDELVAALCRGCEARLLLCRPRSEVCEIRRQSLDPGMDVKRAVEDTFCFLQRVARRAPGDVSRAPEDSCLRHASVHDHLPGR
jgi:hypothetical protein